MKNKKNKKFTFLGMSIWRVLAYFIIYSILGYIIETLFGAITKGVIESIKSFLYGPFCAIYGLGAVIMIGLLQYFKKNNYTLFFGGFLIGSVVEYLVSLFGEMMLHVKWWDYSNYILNINGRICLLYSIFWGLLTIILIKRINPRIDSFIDFLKIKFPSKLLKILLSISIFLIIIDCIATCYAQTQFIIRMAVENNIEIRNYNKVVEKYQKTYSNDMLSKLILTLWNDKKMIRTFPNLKIEDINHNVIYIDSLLPEIQPYYIKVFEK